MPIPMNMNNEQQRQLEWWHYSNNQKPDYKDTLEGTLIEIDIVQKRGWNDAIKKSTPEFWPDGNPKRAYRWIILDAITGLPTAFEFNDTKNDSFKKAIVQGCPGITDMEMLGGHYLKIHTPDGVYNLQHPRPFTVQDLGVSNVPYEGTKDLLSNVKPQAPSPFPDMQWNQQAGQPMPGQGYQQPAQQYQQQPAQQAVPQQGVMPGGYPAQNPTQYQSAPVQQPIQQQVPGQQVPVPVQQVPTQVPQAAPIQQAVPQQTAAAPAPIQGQPQPAQQTVQQVPQHQDMQQGQVTNGFYDPEIPF